QERLFAEPGRKRHDMTSVNFNERTNFLRTETLPTENCSVVTSVRLPKLLVKNFRQPRSCQVDPTFRDPESICFVSWGHGERSNARTYGRLVDSLLSHV